MAKSMNGKGWYNGYPWKEREAKFEVLKLKQSSKELIAAGPCALCGDSNADFEFHDEDYSEPYLWVPPALYCLCRNCHRHRIHKRFAHPIVWTAFLAHVRRGGYASDLAKLEIKKEIEALKSALKKGEGIVLASLRPYKGRAGEEWFSQLTSDRVSLTSPSARPRP